MHSGTVVSSIDHHQHIAPNDAADINNNLKDIEIVSGDRLGDVASREGEEEWEELGEQRKINVGGEEKFVKSEIAFIASNSSEIGHHNNHGLQIRDESATSVGPSIENQKSEFADEGCDPCKRSSITSTYLNNEVHLQMSLGGVSSKS